MPGEVERFLRKHGASSSKVIAKGVRARRVDVDRVLASDRFRRVSPPAGVSPRTVLYVVGTRRDKLPARAARMLSVLADGHGHSRVDIVAEASINYPNNAASELRAAGYDVRTRYLDGEVFYWIESFPADFLADAA